MNKRILSEKINITLKFLENNRGQGTTTLLSKVQSENKCFFVVDSEQEASKYNNGVSIENLKKIQGIRNPVIFDNKVLLDILYEMKEYIRIMDKEYSDLLLESLGHSKDTRQNRNNDDNINVPIL